MLKHLKRNGDLLANIILKGRLAISGNASLVAVAFLISHRKCQKEAFWWNFGGLLEKFVWYVAGEVTGAF
jgi:hypothetical protein